MTRSRIAQRSARIFRHLLIALPLTGALAFGAYHAIRNLHWHDSLISMLAGNHADKALWNQSAWRSHARWLPGYRLASVRAIPEIESNLSGLSLADDRNLLLGVINRPAAIVALSLDGGYSHSYPLHGISDAEGIAYLGQGRVAVSSEKQGAILLLRLPDQPGPIDLQGAPSLRLIPPEDDNSGLEGLGYDSVRDQLYAVKEQSPRALFRIDNLCPSASADCGTEHAVVHDLSRWLDSAQFARDLSSVEFDTEKGHLLVLSEQSQTLLEFDSQGIPVSTQHIGARSGNPLMPQAEGLALGADGTIYLASEPNLLYRFVPEIASRTVRPD